MTSVHLPTRADPAGPPRLPALDALRALGAAAVVGAHVAFATGASSDPAWGGVLARLDVGVAIFFVLSGFLLFRPYAHAAAHGVHRPDAGPYLWRRALRVLPAYWITVAVCLTVLPGNADVPRAEWLRYAIFAQTYEYGHLHEGLGQTWSLAVEAAFYLLLPLVATPVLGAAWRPARTVGILLTGGTLITAGWLTTMAAGRLDMGLHTNWLPAFAAWFAAGMALAAVHVAVASGTAPGVWRAFAEVGRAPLTCWSLAVGLLVIAGTPLAGPRDLTEPSPAQFAARTALFLAISVAIVLPVAFAAPGRIRSALCGPVAGWLGAVSYGLFLWHPFVLTILRPANDAPVLPAGPALTYLLTLAGGLALAALSWYGLERPLQRWERRRAARRARDSAAVRPDAIVVTPVVSAPSQSTVHPASAAS